MKYLEKIITKELLREVLPKEIENLSEDFSFYIDEDYIVFRDEGETLFDYNIYKFAFKSKEWAFKKNYTIVDGIDEIGEDICYIMEISGYSLESYYEQGKNYHNVFKACNWVLEKEIQEENRLQLQEDLTEYNKLIKEGL